MEDRFSFRAWHEKTEHMYKNVVVGPKDKIGYKLGGNRYTYEKKEEVIIMQQIEAEDKNDKMIYEGDVIEISQKGKAIVKWDHKSFKFIVEYVDSGKTEDFGNWHSKRSVEVLGNLYENPELLKDEEDEE